VTNPYAAPTESRLSTTDVSAIVSERNAMTRTTIVRPRTNAMTRGMRRLSWSRKSALQAVSPVTPASVPATAPSVAATLARSTSSDWTAASEE
jgi:hypothetical protein